LIKQVEVNVDSVNVSDDTGEGRRFVEERKTSELAELIATEGLKPDETRAFVANAFRDGAIPTTGIAVTKILPPVSRCAAGNNHAFKKQSVLDKLAAFFDRFFGLV
jgi:type I restriction enzyme, R subunit